MSHFNRGCSKSLNSYRSPVRETIVNHLMNVFCSGLQLCQIEDKCLMHPGQPSPHDIVSNKPQVLHINGARKHFTQTALT